MVERRLLIAAVALVGAVAVAPASLAQVDESAEAGRDLFQQRCSSCHGAEGGGTERGPSLIGAGAASADFQLRTGRMPAADSIGQPPRKPPAFGEDEIVALVRYVDSLGEGPPIPEVDLTGRSISNGHELFIENCAACHGATAAGGAVGGGAFAPSLDVASPTEIAEAMITGPGQMPQFDLDDDDQNDVVNYVVFLRNQATPGGADIGGVGPVPEGWVAWILGMGALLALSIFIAREQKEHTSVPGRDKNPAAAGQDVVPGRDKNPAAAGQDVVPGRGSKPPAGQSGGDR